MSMSALVMPCLISLLLCIIIIVLSASISSVPTILSHRNDTEENKHNSMAHHHHHLMYLSLLVRAIEKDKLVQQFIYHIVCAGKAINNQ